MKRTLAVMLLALALALGLFADLGIRNGRPGLCLFLWMIGLVFAVFAGQRVAQAELVRGWKWMAGAVVVMGGTFLWRDSEALIMFALLAAAGALVLITLSGAKPKLWECGFLEYGHAGVLTAAHTAVGFPMLILSDLRSGEMTQGRAPGHAFAVIRGVAITVPVVFVLGALFVGADAVFQDVVYSIIDIDLAQLFGHIFFTGFFAWIVAGYLRGAFIARPTPFPYAQTRPLSLGITEVAIVLGSSIALFGLFMIVQFRYLFGGADLVQVTPSLTYAQYARRGFFELTAVVALVLPMLLVLDWVLRKENARHVRAFRILALIQVALLFAVIGSALQRMLLYQAEYGLTELRVFTVAFMGWMAVLLVWYIATVLTGKRARFAFGAVSAAFVILFLLVAMNPDDIIARTNITRAREGKQMDAKYLTTLSDDAVPTLVEGFASLDQNTKAVLAKNLLKRKNRLADLDWRSWNWSSSAALSALAGHEEELKREVVH